jgi:hypothetical protein
MPATIAAQDRALAWLTFEQSDSGVEYLDLVRRRRRLAPTLGLD